MSGASWYQIWVNRNGRTHWVQWVEGETSWRPEEDWEGGEYSWWVRGWGPSTGYRSWSEASGFSIPVRAPEGIVQLSPQGPREGTEVTYRWEKDANATWYRLWVGGEGTGTWHDLWFNLTGTGEAAVVPGTSRPLNARPSPTGPAGQVGPQPTLAWSGGRHTWWLRGWGPDGFGPWSGPLAFTVPYPDNTWVRIYLNRGNANVFDLWTSEGSLTPPSILQSGSYSWWMGVWDPELNRTHWSERMEFSVQASAIEHSLLGTWRDPYGEATITYLSDGTYQGQEFGSVFSGTWQPTSATTATRSWGASSTMYIRLINDTTYVVDNAPSLGTYTRTE